MPETITKEKALEALEQAREKARKKAASTAV